MKNTVESTHKTYDAWLSMSLLPRTLMDGAQAMRDKGEKFLPKDHLEIQEDYENRLKRSALLNFFRKTIIFLSGQVYQKDIVFDDKFPESLDVINDDIDLQGNSINVYAKRNFERGLAEGCVHTIVDSTNKDGEFTSKAEEQKAGVRPYFREIQAKNLIGWRIEGKRLTQIKIKETIEIPYGDFGVKEEDQIRVYEIGKWTVYRKNGKSKIYEFHESGTNSLDFIPIASFIPGEPTSLLTGDSPLMDLAELNKEHWQSKSDQKNILHSARCPKLFSKMLDLKVLKNSPHNIINSDNKDADLKYVEITGKAIESGQKDLTEIEAKAALYGLQQLIPRSGNQTATEKSLNSAESDSQLSHWSKEYQTYLRVCYFIASKYQNEGSFNGEQVSVNQEFSVGYINFELINAMAKLVEDEIISAASAFKELKKKGFISEELDWIEVQKEIENEKQNSTSLLNFGANNGNE